MYKEFLTEEIVKDNAPELTKEEKVLLAMDTLDVPKVSASKTQEQGPSEFKMLEA